MWLPHPGHVLSSLVAMRLPPWEGRVCRPYCKPGRDCPAPHPTEWERHPGPRVTAPDAHRASEEADTRSQHSQLPGRSAEDRVGVREHGEEEAAAGRAPGSVPFLKGHVRGRQQRSCAGTQPVTQPRGLQAQALAPQDRPGLLPRASLVAETGGGLTPPRNDGTQRPLGPQSRPPPQGRPRGKSLEHPQRLKGSLMQPQHHPSSWALPLSPHSWH